jgi:hypothetical protein
MRLAMLLAAIALSFGIAIAGFRKNISLAREGDARRDAWAACAEAPTRVCVLDLLRGHALSHEDARARARGLADIALALARLGLNDDSESAARLALDAAANLGDAGRETGDILERLAAALVWRGKFVEAEDMAAAMDRKTADRENGRRGDGYWRGRILSSIAAGKAIAASKKVIAAGQTWGTGAVAVGLAQLQSISEPGVRNAAIRRFAWELRFAALEQSEEDKLIAALRAERRPLMSSPREPGVKWEEEPALAIIISALAQKGRFNEAWRIAAWTTEPDDRANAFAIIGETQIPAQGATPFLQRLRSTDDGPARRKTMENLIRRLAALKEDARSHALEDNDPQSEADTAGVAGEKMPGALRLARSFGGPAENELAFGVIAAAQVRWGAAGAAQQALREIRDDGSRSEVLGVIGKAQAARELSSQAPQRSRDPVEKARASAALALTQAKAGRNAEALRMSGESLRAARLISDHQEKTAALWRVAGTLP